jgi:hypothetical protein
MKNYNNYQAGITASTASGFPAQDPYATYKPENREAPSNNNGGYMLIAIFVGVVMIGYFVVMTMNKPPALDTTQLGTTTGSPSTTSSTAPGTTSSPLPGQPVISQPVGTQPTNTPPPTTDGVTFGN